MQYRISIPMARSLTALQIMETTLNGGTVKVYDEVSRPERKSGVAKVLNKVETLAAQEKQELLQNVFQEWVRKDPSRVKRMKKNSCLHPFIHRR